MKKGFQKNDALAMWAQHFIDDTMSFTAVGDKVSPMFNELR